MDEVSFGLAILIGAWGFFVTAQPRRRKHGCQGEQRLPKDYLQGITTSESENWSFEPGSSDRNTIEQGDRWVMG